ncbi:hypothetical protein DIPPA_07628 [Diplonema papillatum]|nr:hypothetical protein DIPPA_07628 [Diplonema papillatum]
MRVRNYWYHHPPKPWVMVSYLFLLLFVNLIIAFLPVSVNYNRFYALWRDLAKPAFVYEEPTALILAWALAHVVSSLGPWFVYLSGGWLAHKWDILPCFLMMACEALLPDLMFGARRLDYTFFCTLACCGLCVLSMYKSARTTYLATAAFFPLLGCYVYLALLSASMWDLNGYKYTLRVI